MSNRHQIVSRPAKADRRVEHHRERQATRAALHGPDLEEALTPPSAHNVTVSLSNHPVEANRPRFRHWKQAFWKRRTTTRHDRNTAENRLVDRSDRDEDLR
jgi:hypothetical protein